LAPFTTLPSGVLHASGPTEARLSFRAVRVGLGPITTGGTGANAFTRRLPTPLNSTDRARTTFGMAFCSLLIAEGLSVVEIAQQAGHSPAMMLATYAHVIEELAGTERRPAEAVIRDARDKLVSEMCPPARRQRLH
jgi:hypothetical protein